MVDANDSGAGETQPDAGNAGAGETQPGAKQQKPSVPLREHLAHMFPHVVEEYHVTPFTEPAHDVGAKTLDAVLTNVMLRHAQRTLSGASIRVGDFGAFIPDKGYVARTVDFVTGPFYGADPFHFTGIPMKNADEIADAERVLASQATLLGYLNDVPGHDEPRLKQKEPSRGAAARYAGALGGLAVVAGMVTSLAIQRSSEPTMAGPAAFAAGIVSAAFVDYMVRRRSNTPKNATEDEGSAPITEKSFNTTEIADAARAHYANLENLYTLLDFRVTVTDTEMMNGLMRPFSDIEKSVREELGYLSPERREVEMQNRRTQHIDAQASLQNALCLYMAVERQLSALEPLVRYKGLLPPPMPKPDAQAAGAAA